MKIFTIHRYEQFWLGAEPLVIVWKWWRKNCPTTHSPLAGIESWTDFAVLA
jgi:hypothetical protein